MAANIKENIRNMAKELLHKISETSDNLRMMEVTDHFELIEELGSGSYGKVHMGKYKHSGQIVAVKMLTKEKTQRDNFLLEYCISLALSCHPHIIRTHEMVFHTRRDFVFVQEVAAAGSLHSIIKPKIGIKEDMVKRCAPQIASALDYMHSRGMVHRDLKPDNILLMDEDCHWIKVADFGFTRLQDTYVPSLSRYAPYFAPELCCLRKGEQLLLHPSLDVWSFGVLLYIALTGGFPWKGAVGCDQSYKEFAWWLVKKDRTKAPEKWTKISVEAREMFWDLLSINASERSTPMVIRSYMHLPWKVEAP